MKKMNKKDLLKNEEALDVEIKDMRKYISNNNK